MWAMWAMWADSAESDESSLLPPSASPPQAEDARSVFDQFVATVNNTIGFGEETFET